MHPAAARARGAGTWGTRDAGRLARRRGPGGKAGTAAPDHRICFPLLHAIGSPGLRPGPAQRGPVMCCSPAQRRGGGARVPGARRGTRLPWGPSSTCGSSRRRSLPPRSPGRDEFPDRELHRGGRGEVGQGEDPRAGRHPFPDPFHNLIPGWKRALRASAIRASNRRSRNSTGSASNSRCQRW